MTAICDLCKTEYHNYTNYNGDPFWCSKCLADLQARGFDKSLYLVLNDGKKQFLTEESRAKFIETMKRIERDLKGLQARIAEEWRKHVEHESKENSGAKKTQKA